MKTAALDAAKEPIISTSSSADAPVPEINRIVLASIAGNALEWYDYFLYGTAAALVFGRLFFPAGIDPMIGTLGAFAGFAVGFAARPLGGVFFGHIGDRYGRKTVLVFTLTLMGAATFLIGLLPTYSQIGVLAPTLLVALRILQGIAAGGEWGGGVLMISENAPRNRRGFFSAWSQTGVTGGFVLSAAAFLAAQQLPQDQFLSWGWRLPFLASAVIFLVGIYIRSRLPESREFSEVRAAGRQEKIPLIAALQRHRREILVAMGLRFAENGGIFLLLTFSLAYGQFIGASSNVMLFGVLLSMTVQLLTVVLFGSLSDKIGRRPVYLIGAIGLILMAFPFFWLVNTKTPALILLAYMLGNGLCQAAMIGTMPSFLTELFDTDVRYSGIAFSHELGSVFAGGLSPLIATLLFATYKTYWPISIYIILLGAVTAVAVLCVAETRRRA